MLTEAQVRDLLKDQQVMLNAARDTYAAIAADVTDGSQAEQAIWFYTGVIAALRDARRTGHVTRRGVSGCPSRLKAICLAGGPRKKRLIATD